MAMLKVNSIIAESHYNIVINKVAGNAISPLTLLTATIRHFNKKKKKTHRKTTEGPERMFHSLKIQNRLPVDREA